MSTNTYTDPVLTTELHEWVQNDTFVYEGSIYDVDVILPAWNKGLPKEMQPWYGKTLTEEHKKKCSESSMGEKNGYYGKKHSPEIQEKMREAQANRPAHTEQQKRLIGEANSKRVWSEEAKKKISAAHKGKTISEEHKRKISEYWARRREKKL